jgi:hypothetical membrane protein
MGLISLLELDSDEAGLAGLLGVIVYYVTNTVTTVKTSTMMRTANRTLLIGMILLPVFYFGIQALLAPAYPGYSLLRDTASDLGASASPVARWFNLLAVVGGLLGIVGAWAAYRTLLIIDGSLFKAILLPLVVAFVAAGSIWAGIFPMPNPLHPMNPSTPAMLVMPLVALAYAWWAPALRLIRVPVLINFVAFLIILPFMFGLVLIDRGAFGGLLQRLLAATVFLPIGLIGWALRHVSFHQG